jgi:hypothetical protein
MRHLAKTYQQFINEAYIDDSGELQDFNYPDESDYDYQMLDHAQRIQEYLEESGAEDVRLQVDEGIIFLKFNYEGIDYRMHLDLDSNSAVISVSYGKEPVEVYRDTIDSLFDLLTSTGLEFLNY